MRKSFTGAYVVLMMISLTTVITSTIPPYSDPGRSADSIGWAALFQTHHWASEPMVEPNGITYFYCHCTLYFETKVMFKCKGAQEFALMKNSTLEGIVSITLKTF